MNRPHHYNNEYRRELFNKIESLPAQVFTRQDLATSQSNQEQLRLNRALKAFLDAGTITKLGHGLYGKAMQMDFPNGEVGFPFLVQHVSRHI